MIWDEPVNVQENGVPADDPRRSGSRDFVVVSTADWDAPLWTNKQHTARTLRDRGGRVLYVESMGLRPPRLTSVDLRRIGRRIARMCARPVEVEPDIWRLAPPSIPLQRYRAVRALNRILCSLVLRFWTRRILGAQPTYWVYNPLATKLIAIPADADVVYHCVDDIGAQPDMPGDVIDAAETELVERASRVFVTSRELEQKWAAFAQKTSYFPNCVDAEHFATPGSPPPALRPDGAARPTIGFVGAVAAYKMEVAHLVELFGRRADWRLVVAGPREDDSEEISQLLVLPNVVYLGLVPYADLPGLMQGFDVGIIPARHSRYTRSMFPMKFFEYLAAGVPVVSTDIPALAGFADVARIVPIGRFEEAIAAVLAGEVADAAARRRVVQDNTYALRTARMLASVDASA